MAEAIATLGLAASILQVVDFGNQFVSHAWKIWQSGAEGVEMVSSLQKLTHGLKVVTQHLQDDVDQLPASPNQPSMVALAKDCAKAADKMLNTLEKLRLPDRGQKRRALKAAFALVGRKEDIQALETQLQEFRSQLTLNLLVSIRSCATKSLENQNAIIERLGVSRNKESPQGSVQKRLGDTDDGIGTLVVEYLVKQLHLERNDHSEAEKGVLEEDISRVLYRGVQGESTSEALRIDISDARQHRLQSIFLFSLKYADLEDREQRIAKAHEITFRWIFESEDKPGPSDRVQPHFREWLESDERLFWITGKAGSGKSTLMKFICYPISKKTGPADSDTLGKPEARCAQYLRRWAGEKPLVIASFFFWGAGSAIQASATGLFRTLLHNMLSQYPAAIQHVAPERWETLCLFGRDPKPFTEDELRNMLFVAIEYISSVAKLCVFVDGLDEFDGDHKNLIGLFQRIISHSSAKVCVASRPWVVFEDSFKHQPNLMLQDLTYLDIKDFVTTRLVAESDFALLEKREPVFAAQLIERIVEKASGVFLWVHLVVNSLISGMGHGDRISDLQRRLDRLPPDLEDLYQRILDDLDPFYFEHAAYYFQLMDACQEPPSALEFSFADEEDPTFSLGLAGRIADDAIATRVEVIRRRVNSRCKGLLEVDTRVRVEPRVQYLHKTVKDFINSPKAQQRLATRPEAALDPHLHLCSANFALCKAYYQLGDRLKWMVACLQHASQVKPKSVSVMIRLLDAAKLVAEQDGFFDLVGHDNYETSRLLSLGSPFKTMEYFGYTFLSLAAMYGVTQYIEVRAQDECLVRRNLVGSLLQTSYRVGPLQFSWSRRRTWKQGLKKVDHPDTRPLLLDAIPITGMAPQPQVVAALLRKGADPNYALRVYVWGRREGGAGIDSLGNTTVWEIVLTWTLQTLATLHLSSDPLALETPLLEIVNLMIKHGAKTDYGTVASVVDATAGLVQPRKRGILELRQALQNSVKNDLGVSLLRKDLQAWIETYRAWILRGRENKRMTLFLPT